MIKCKSCGQARSSVLDGTTAVLAAGIACQASTEFSFTSDVVLILYVDGTNVKPVTVFHIE